MLETTTRNCFLCDILYLGFDIVMKGKCVRFEISFYQIHTKGLQDTQEEENAIFPPDFFFLAQYLERV